MSLAVAPIKKHKGFGGCKGGGQHSPAVSWLACTAVGLNSNFCTNQLLILLVLKQLSWLQAEHLYHHRPPLGEHRGIGVVQRDWRQFPVQYLCS